MDSSSSKRVTLRPKKCPNPLFQKWLTEWKNDAKDKGSDMKYVYSKALASLNKYPLVLKSGRECAILQHFGVKLCSMLDKKLAEHNLSHNNASSPETRTFGEEKTGLPINNKSRRAVHRNKQTYTYVNEDTVVYEPGSFRIQLFVDSGETNGLKSRSVSSKGSHKDVLLSQLSTAGVPFEVRKLSVGDFAWGCIPDNFHSGNTAAAKMDDKILMLPYIIERKRVDDLGSSIRDGRFHEQKVSVLNETVKKQLAGIGRDGFGIKFSHSCVEAPVSSTIPSTLEFKKLLKREGSWEDTGIGRERKVFNDCLCNISAVFRLKKSGMWQVVYLIEGLSEKLGVTDKESSRGLHLPISTLQQASANTEVVDRFIVKDTKGLKDTADYLAMMTSLLAILFQKKKLKLCKKDELPAFSVADDVLELMSLSEFNKSSTKCKDLTVSQMFIRHLLQIRGLSVEKAQAIIEKYPTPCDLCRAYSDDPSKRQLLLANIPFGPNRRLIGPTLSKVVSDLYSSEVIK